MKKAISLLVALITIFSLFTSLSLTVSAYSVSRDDGTWLFPLPSSYYNSFSDWAGCPGTRKCVFCGVYHTGWGDNVVGHSTTFGHNGIDIAAPAGTNVYAAASGKAYTFYNSARGNTIVIEHTLGNGYSYYTYYQHLSSFSISNGTHINMGTTIGKVGSTGDSGGNHLHFGILMGTSGQIGNNNLLNSLEGKGWITTSGNKSGRILNNPASSNDAGFPKGLSGVVAPLKAHYGSIHYTFDRYKVSINPSVHTHSYTKNVYYLKSHPHYQCYACSCGDVKENKNEPTYISTCRECNIPSKPSLKNIQSTYTSRDNIIFSWNNTEHTTHHNVYIKKKNSDGAYSWYSHDRMVSSGFSKNLPAGEYSVVLQAYNSNFWLDGQTDWVHTDSDTYYITVEDTGYTVIYNANGGKGSMEDTIVDFGVPTALRINTFERTGYTFGGWEAYRESDNKWYYTNGTKTGWYTKGKEPTGYTKYIYKDGEKISKTTSVNGDIITMYAVWKPNKYTIKYNANGGTGIMNNTVTEYGRGTVLSAHTFKNSEYGFKGWYAYRTSDKKWCYTDGTDIAWYEKDSQPEGYARHIYRREDVVHSITSANNDIVIMYAVWKKGTYEVKEIDSNKVLIKNYMGSASEVIIPSTINGKKVVGIDLRAFSFCRSLKSVTIPSSVKNINDYAFHKCINLKSIIIPNSVTNIGCNAFTNCSSLETINIPANIKRIETSVFSYTGLKSIIIPSNVTSIGEFAFYGCENLKSVTIPKTVTSIGAQAFGYLGYQKKQDNFIITGCIDTVAEEYAINNDFTFNPNKYTVKYNKNGGTGTMSNTSVTYGTSKALRANTFKRAGYTFKGWIAYRESDKKWYYTNGTKTGWYTKGNQPAGYSRYVYSNKAKVSKTTAVNGDTVTMYAVWTANKYTVKYNKNGGTGTMSNTSVTYGTSKALRANTFRRTGYTFKGWRAYRASDKKWYYTNGTKTGWYTKGNQPAGYSRYVYSNKAKVSKTTAVNGDTVTMYATWKKR